MEPVEDMPMNIRENMEQRELELLSPYAAHSGHSRGRERIEEECDVRTVYQRDRDRILHCKAFRGRTEWRCHSSSDVVYLAN